jgi:hypothetical protein
MRKYVAVMTGVAAILAVATLTSSSVNAGGSSSAPSKYAAQTHSAHLRADQTRYPITEYSSSSRRTTPKH